MLFNNVLKSIADKIFIPIVKTEIDTVYVNVHHLPTKKFIVDRLKDSIYLKFKFNLEEKIKNHIINKTNYDIFNKIYNEYLFRDLIFENEINFVYNYWKSKYLSLLEKINEDEKFELIYNSYDSIEYKWSRDTLEDIKIRKKIILRIFEQRLNTKSF